MAKGDDALLKKSNKKARKKLNKRSDTATVSSRVSAIIASKKRRKAGKRRMCEGMCFSLPTIEDPFNDRLGKKVFSKKDRKPKRLSSDKESFGKRKVKNENGLSDAEDSYCPSKFLMLCLNQMDDAFHNQDSEEAEDQSLSISRWGVDFLQAYIAGDCLLETSGSPSTTEQIAWIVSTAADAMSKKEEDDLLSFSTPYLLYLVSSQAKAAEVRSVCKPLKSLGVHTVSIHPGASVDHQIFGLKSCEPEFLISTPERLLELVSKKAVDISRLSVLVIDDLETLKEEGSLEAIRSIKEAIRSKHHTIAFGSSTLLRSLHTGPVTKLSLSM